MYVAGVGKDQTTNDTGCVVCPLDQQCYIFGQHKLFLDVCHYALTLFHTITTFNNLEREGF